MSRLEKKCLVASAGMHGLLFLMLFAVPLLWVSKQQPLVLPELNFVPTRLIDGVMSGGGSPTAQAPPPAAATRAAPPQVMVVPPPPKADVAPPKQEALAKPEVEPVPKQPAKRSDPVPTDKKLAAAKPDDSEDAADAKVGKKRIRLDFTRATGSSKSASDARSQAQTAARAAQTLADARAAQVSRVLGSIGQGLSTGTSIDIPGPGGEAYAPYASFVVQVYRSAWSPSSAVADRSVRAQVVILRDGTVESFEIIKRSGDSALDKSVERLKSIRSVAPFPAGALDEKRTFVIRFTPTSNQE